MNPLTALGLAANIFQFVEFTGKLASAGYEIHHTGASTTELDSRLVTNDLNRLNVNLRASIKGVGAQTSLSEDDQVMYSKLAKTSTLIIAGTRDTGKRMHCHWQRSSPLIG